MPDRIRVRRPDRAVVDLHPIWTPDDHARLQRALAGQGVPLHRLHAVPDTEPKGDRT